LGFPNPLVFTRCQFDLEETDYEPEQVVKHAVHVIDGVIVDLPF